MRDKTRFANSPAHLGPEIAVALAAVAMYVRTLGYDFVFDDLSLIGPDGPRWYGNATLPYRPLRYLSYWIDHLLGGGAAWTYHGANVALHAATAVVVVRLGRRFGAGPWIAGLAGLAFAWHPLATEVTAYVSGRRDLLATLFGLGALLSWTRRPARGTALAVVLLLAAVASKESGLLFLPLLFVVSALGTGPPLRVGAKTLLPAAVAAIALPVAYGAVGPLAPAGALFDHLVVAGRLAAHYAAGLVWPVGLSVEYPALILPDPGGVFGISPNAWAGLVLSSAAVALIVYQLVGAKRHRPAAVAAAGMFLAISFIIGSHEPGADRHAYPLVALCAVSIAEAAARCSIRRRVGTGVVVLVAVCWFAVLTDRQIPVWADQGALWAATVQAAPGSVRANHNLAGVLLETGDIDGARRALARARRNDPRYAPAYLGQALIDCTGGRPVRGRRFIERARARGADPAEAAAVAETCAQAARSDHR
jgi:hypothetical protein